MSTPCRPRPGHWLRSSGLALLLALAPLLVLLSQPLPLPAMLQSSPGETATGLVRSLESLRDQIGRAHV